MILVSKLDPQTLWRLRDTAIGAARNAYFPYSAYRVGASALWFNGTISHGCNVENSSLGLTICAERNAIFRGVADGARDLVALAVYTPTSAPAAPCGACRQVVQEFGPHAEIVSFCDGPRILTFSLDELLPYSFGSRQLRTSGDGQKRICVDIDNVIAETDAVMRDVIREVTDGRVDLAYSDVRTFNYWECADRCGNSISREEWDDIHDRFSDAAILSKIRPVKGVQTELRRLAERYVLHFATSRLPKARPATLNWLEEHEFPPHDIHFLKHGEKHISLGRFEASIEDDPAQARAFSDHGTRWSFLLAHPWNESEASNRSLRRVSSWSEISRLLIDSDQIEK